MFDQLIGSSQHRRRHTTGKFFLMTSAMYVFAIAGAFVVSVLAFDARLPESGDVTHVISLPAPLGHRPRNPGPEPASKPAPRPDYRNVDKLENLLHREPGPPPFTIVDHFNADAGLGASDGPAGPGIGFGVVGGDAKTDPAPRPDPPKPKPAPQPSPADQRPLRVVSQVLQGKAIERVVPVYPALGKNIRLQGDVSVEVIISPEGRVESARAVSGHPLLTGAAVDAARRWRFGPTLLNNVPVRVTGVIVFVFRLNE
jgi:TonB family protein